MVRFRHCGSSNAEPPEIRDKYAPAPARAGIAESEPNELLEQMNGDRVERFAAGSTIQGNTQLATVGKIDRTDDA
jgi:hypothetical protein